MSYVSVGQERDFTPDKTIDVNTDAAWPIIHNLHEPVFPYFVPYDPWFGLFDTPHEMYDGHRGELWGSVTIDGTMRVYRTVNLKFTIQVFIYLKKRAILEHYRKWKLQCIRYAIGLNHFYW